LVVDNLPAALNCGVTSRRTTDPDDVGPAFVAAVIIARHRLPERGGDARAASRSKVPTWVPVRLARCSISSRSSADNRTLTTELRRRFSDLSGRLMCVILSPHLLAANPGGRFVLEYCSAEVVAPVPHYDTPTETVVVV
jgi:hypothetical protein